VSSSGGRGETWTRRRTLEDLASKFGGRVVSVCCLAPLSPTFTSQMSRQASISRKTNETQIEVHLNLDCAPGSNFKQIIDVSTGIGFLDHVCSTGAKN